MESEHGIKPRGIADITLFPRPPLHSFGVTIAQVVIDHGGEICRRQGQAGMGTNIAGTAGNQNSRAVGMVAPECAAAASRPDSMPLACRSDAAGFEPALTWEAPAV